MLAIKIGFDDLCEINFTVKLQPFWAVLFDFGATATN